MHSKVLVVDDTLMTVGSANLNNRFGWLALATGAAIGAALWRQRLSGRPRERVDAGDS